MIDRDPIIRVYPDASYGQVRVNLAGGAGSFRLPANQIEQLVSALTIYQKQRTA